MAYNTFLEKLVGMPPATACWHAEINAKKHGKTPMEVSRDFFSKFGVHLGN